MLWGQALRLGDLMALLSLSFKTIGNRARNKCKFFSGQENLVSDACQATQISDICAHNGILRRGPELHIRDYAPSNVKGVRVYRNKG